MITTNMILDLLREQLGSDYKSAKALGIPQQRVSKMRAGKGILTDEQGLKAAEILGFPEEFIILSLAAERSMDSPAYNLLVDISDRFDPRKTAAVAALFIFTGLATLSDTIPAFFVV